MCHSRVFPLRSGFTPSCVLLLRASNAATTCMHGAYNAWRYQAHSKIALLLADVESAALAHVASSRPAAVPASLAQRMRASSVARREVDSTTACFRWNHRHLLTQQYSQRSHSSIIQQHLQSSEQSGIASTASFQV